ncbi:MULTISPECIES: DUF3292 domain-containing protein [Acinetobacter]|uniref:DUF3292 domain-containing protein n=1 Tax=Acinetobacter TaxID=469 RepID=UPI001C4B2394|nr:DUF3292 domain-containing protein [Acinetobacter sp. Colony158]
MSIVLGVFLIMFGMYILYVLSIKQIEKTKKSKLHFMTQHINILRLFACLLFLVAGSLFIAAYGTSIGFVSWWLFATPLVFALILYLNDLKPKAGKRNQSSRVHKI